MNFSEFQAQMRRQLEEPVEGVWSDTSILYWTNEEAVRLAKRAKCLRDEVYASATAGQWSYALPDYTLEPIAVYLDGNQLSRVDYGDIRVLNDDTTGTPVFFAVTEGELVLRPTPDADGVIRYFRYALPEPITDGSEEMPFDSQYNTIIEYGVLRRAFEQISDWTSAEMYRARYEDIVGEISVQKGIERQVLRSTSPREVY